MRDFEDFESLKKWLDAKPSLKGEVHEHQYTEVFAINLARPGDEKVAERKVAQMIANQVDGMGTGLIYWRIPLEWRIEDCPQIIEFCEDGPDVDFMTDKKCRMDHNWKAVKAYCRLAVKK